MTGRLIRCLLLCVAIGLTARVLVPAYHVHAQGTHMAHTTATMRQALTPTSTLPTIPSRNGGPAASMAVYVLIVGLLLTVIALIGLQACRRTTGRFRYSLHRYQTQQ